MVPITPITPPRSNKVIACKRLNVRPLVIFT